MNKMHYNTSEILNTNMENLKKIAIYEYKTDNFSNFNNYAKDVSEDMFDYYSLEEFKEDFDKDYFLQDDFETYCDSTKDNDITCTYFENMFVLTIYHRSCEIKNKFYLYVNKKGFRFDKETARKTFDYIMSLVYELLERWLED